MRAVAPSKAVLRGRIPSGMVVVFQRDSGLTATSVGNPSGPSPPALATPTRAPKVCSPRRSGPAAIRSLGADSLLGQLATPASDQDNATLLQSASETIFQS